MEVCLYTNDCTSSDDQDDSNSNYSFLSHSSNECHGQFILPVHNPEQRKSIITSVRLSSFFANYILYASISSNEMAADMSNVQIESILVVTAIVTVFLVALFCLACSLNRSCSFYGNGCDSDGNNRNDDELRSSSLSWCCTFWKKNPSNHENQHDDENPSVHVPPQAYTSLNDIIFHCSIDDDGDNDSNSENYGRQNENRRNMGSNQRRKRRRSRQSGLYRPSQTPTTMQQFFPDLLAETSIVTDDSIDDEASGLTTPRNRVTDQLQEPLL